MREVPVAGRVASMRIKWDETEQVVGTVTTAAQSVRDAAEVPGKCVD